MSSRGGKLRRNVNSSNPSSIVSPSPGGFDGRSTASSGRPATMDVDNITTPSIVDQRDDIDQSRHGSTSKGEQNDEGLELRAHPAPNTASSTVATIAKSKDMVMHRRSGSRPINKDQVRIDNAHVISPTCVVGNKNADNDDDENSEDSKRKGKTTDRKPKGRRTLFPSNTTAGDDTTVPIAGASISSVSSGQVSASHHRHQPSKSSIVTPTKSNGDDDDTTWTINRKRRTVSETTEEQQQPAAKRRLIFGRYVDFVPAPANVTEVYSIVRKLTGSIGGNGYCGPIYGELTMNSMQKVVDWMIRYTNFNSSSRFIDVGSGIGKPNLHVAQYPGVAYSCGVEMEETRWALGMACLKAVLGKVVKQQQKQQQEEDEEEGDKPRNHQQKDNDKQQQPVILRSNTVFLHKNITEAKIFDPFTHVYMFSIGFPPSLWLDLAEMWNRSSAECEYMICYHSPKNIIDSYGFHVRLLTQLPTSMHGSKEGHTSYIYQRIDDVEGKGTSESTISRQSSTKSTQTPCDPLFRQSYKMVQDIEEKEGGLATLYEHVSEQVHQCLESGRPKRSKRSATSTTTPKRK